METVLIRAGIADAPLSRERLTSARQPSTHGLLAALVRSLAERVTLPHRALPPEWFRFPLP
jgi:hypothetical protein